MTFLRIIPDSNLTNKRVEELLRVVSGMYTAPLHRMHKKGILPLDCATWEIIIKKDSTEFYLTVPVAWQTVIQKQLSVVWPGATVSRKEDPITLQPTKAATLELKNHYLFPLKTDFRTAGILPSLLETAKLLSTEQSIAVQMLLEPAPVDWWHDACEAYEEYTKGKMPSRTLVKPKDITKQGIKCATWVIFGFIQMINEMVTNEQQNYSIDGADKAALLREKPIGQYVADKLKGDALDVTIRIAVQAADPIVADNLLRAAAFSFRSLDGDNSLMMVPANSQKIVAKMQQRKPGFKLNHDYLGLKEVAALVQLPSNALQNEYHIESIKYRESAVPKALTSGGIRLGTLINHGIKEDVFLPVSDHDELCLPHIVIGGMGTGKSTYGTNMGIEAVKNGFGAVIIDPAKGTIGDAIEKALPADKVVRIRFGTKPYALDWREALHSDRGRNRLANELIAFAEAASDEAGAQTVRFMRAAAKAVPTGRLSEVVQLLTDAPYRSALIPKMKRTEKLTWEEFDRLTPNRQTQIAAPILNRLDVILGDDYLADCMTAKDTLDFVSLLQEPKAIILDLPKSILGAEAVDVLVSLLSTKLDLAMVLRTSTHPVFVIGDEPHQYLKSQKTWRSAVVESRKWRFSYCWMFHSWEQIPRGLGEIIKAAGPHYHLYTSSKGTYKELAEEIAPFSIEEAMQTKRHWAINIIRTGGVTVAPFLAQMAAPPSKVP